MTTPNPLPVPKPLVLLEIANFGSITIELNPEKAPKTVENFLKYVKRGHYDGLIFHRVISDFILQGGGHEPGMKEKATDAPIELESNNGLKNTKYTVAMARAFSPDTATAQFFINVVDNDFLNYESPTPSGWGYPVFGAVVDGFHVVDEIKGVKTSRTPYHDNVPDKDVVITKITVVEPT